jgi:superfamily I DNA and/or RNA helicase
MKLLNPNGADRIFWCNTYNNSLGPDRLAKLNESQQLVVSEASAIIKYAKEEPKFYFIQGPPGTGKSYTIVSIIREIFKNAQKQMNGDCLPKILVCSPSNGGCDELARRLKREIGKTFLSSDKIGLINFSMNEKMWGCCL